MSNMKFGHIKPGDTVTRMLAGQIAMELIVGKVDEEFIYTSSADNVVELEHGWKFRRDTGAEVDEELGWDGITKTGSFLTLDITPPEDRPNPLNVLCEKLVLVLSQDSELDKKYIAFLEKNKLPNSGPTPYLLKSLTRDQRIELAAIFGM